MVITGSPLAVTLLSAMGVFLHQETFSYNEGRISYWRLIQSIVVLWLGRTRMSNSLDAGNGNGNMAGLDVAVTSQSWGGSSFSCIHSADDTGLGSAGTRIPDPQEWMGYRAEYRRSGNKEIAETSDKVQVPAGTKLAYLWTPPCKVVCLRAATWYYESSLLISDNGETFDFAAEDAGGFTFVLIPRAKFDTRFLQDLDWDQDYIDNVFPKEFADCDYMITDTHPVM